jgi:CelD/BcsL family acetyltransferase involved in cellulose biosynthesis
MRGCSGAPDGVPKLLGQLAVSIWEPDWPHRRVVLAANLCVTLLCDSSSSNHRELHRLVLLLVHGILREVNSSLRVTLLREIPEDAALRQQWDALVQRVEQPQVFYTYEWSLAVQRAYRTSLQPLLFLGYDEDESLRGVVALAIDGSLSVSFLCATTGDYCDFLSVPDEKQSFVAEVFAALREQGISNITLTNLPADSDTVRAIEQVAGTNGYRYFARTAYVCAQVSLGKLERRPGESKPVLPGKKMVRRSLAAMGREAPVRLEHARTWEEARPLLSQFMRSHVARFLATGRISNMARPERRVFLEELAKLLSEPGWLMLTRMMSGENVLAWNYGFQFRGTWFWYQPTFDSDLEKYSPGFCLLAKLVEDAADHSDLNTVDLGLGAEEYKERFANQTRETLYVTLRTSGVRRAREVLRYRTAEAIKAAPALEEGVRAVLSCSVQLRESLSRDGMALTVKRLAGRLGTAIWSRAAVTFLEWGGMVASAADGGRIESLDLNRLASAVSQYVEDKATLAYLLRCASRWREKSVEGFGFVDANGNLLYFAWVTEFDGFFLSELNSKVEAPSADSVIVFDCWRPDCAGDEAGFERTLALVAQWMWERGKKPWLFSAARSAVNSTASNLPSLRNLERAGFQPRYSLVCQRILGMQSIIGKTPRTGSVISGEVSTRVQERGRRIS